MEVEETEKIMGFFLLLGLACCQSLVLGVGMTLQPFLHVGQDGLPLATHLGFRIFDTKSWSRPDHIDRPSGCEEADLAGGGNVCS